MNDQFSSFYSEKTQERDHFYEKFFIGLKVVSEEPVTNMPVFSMSSRKKQPYIH